jgi:hypothetical protein
VPFDPAHVAALLDAADAAPNHQAQGALYEEACDYIFSEIPGCLVERNVTNIFQTQQIDLAVGCLPVPGGLGLFPTVFLVECKDWDKPVDSATLGYFISILHGRAIRLGVLIAANGITGSAEDMRNAHALGFQHGSVGLNVLVLTAAELRAVTTIEAFVDLLHRRFVRAAASGGIGVP